MGSGFGLNR